MPKALVWIARKKVKTPIIYLPITLFSGNIFIANYNKKIIVKEKMLIQFQTTLETPAYYEKTDYLFDYPMLFDYQAKKRKESEIDPDSKKAKESAKKLGHLYIIDFITKKGLKKYLNLVEKEISLLDSKLWPLK